MSYCIDNKCQLCKNLIISTSVTVVTIDGVDTLVINIPSGYYSNCRRICLVVTQTIPTTATITMPVAISIGGDTTTVYPIVACDCSQITACGIRTRTKYPLRVSTSATSAVFKSLSKINCYPNTNIEVIPVPTATTTVVATPLSVTESSEQVTPLRATRKSSTKEATNE